MPRRVMYLVRSWPRLSQTFVVNEILAQERLGTRLDLYSLSRSDERLVQPQVHAVRAAVHYLDERRPRLAALRDHARVVRSAPSATSGRCCSPPSGRTWRGATRRCRPWDVSAPPCGWPR